MKDKGNVDKNIYVAKVQRLNRLETILIIWVALFLAFVGSEVINKRFEVEVKGEIIFFIIMVLACFAIGKLERFFPSVEVLSADFEKDSVVFRRGRREKRIAYEDIIEVQKMMIINRFHSEKGYYRVKVKTKRSVYALYTGEDSARKLDFNETELSKIYFEFINRGIKCC